MSNKNVSLPSGQGGLQRYFDDYKSNFELTPEVVVAICAAVAVLELVLRFGFLG